MSGFTDLFMAVTAMGLAGCQSTPAEGVLIECVAAGQIAFNTYQKHVDDLGSEGISPSIEILPYQRMHNAILARHMLNGEEPPTAEYGKTWPIPSLDGSIENAITARMKYLSDADIEETERINGKCAKIFRNNRSGF